MEIKYEPKNLELKDSNDNICPCCNSELHKYIGKYKSSKRCSGCRYDDNSFWNERTGNKFESNDYCECKYEYIENDCLYVSCLKCKSLQCKTCNRTLPCSNNNCNIPIQCGTCIYAQSNHVCHYVVRDFKDIWKKSTPIEKLYLHGISKLKILIKNKNLKGCSKYKKNELIKILSPLVNDNDFPIKSI